MNRGVASPQFCESESDGERAEGGSGSLQRWRPVAVSHATQCDACGLVPRVSLNVLCMSFDCNLFAI